MRLGVSLVPQSSLGVRSFLKGHFYLNELNLPSERTFPMQVRVLPFSFS